jgi:hypothetical protein
MEAINRSTSRKTMLKPIQLITILAASAAVFAATNAARAQLVYSQDFSTDDTANWVVNYSHSGSNYASFNFDYTTAGIPPAPHSTGGNTKSLKLSPDITAGSLLNGAVPGVSVSPTNFSITANFDMHADMWINYNGSGPSTLTTGAGGSGSTILYGCGYGTAGTTAQVAGGCDSILVGVCTDTGTSAEMRMYGPSQLGNASYQNGVYQSSGTVAPAYPGEPFVYNNPSGTRAFYTASTWTSVAHPNWLDFFPSTKPPQAQIDLYHQQTNIQCNAGAPDFAWHDVEVQKIGNVIVYLIDGHLVATGNYSSAGTPAGDKLVFTAFDINSTVSTDPNFANLNFVLFANIVVSNLNNVVNVGTTTATCTEADTNTPAVFTLTRTATSGPLTVNFTLGGTATNGVQYKPTPLSATFPDGASSVDVDIYPTDDGVPRLTTSVILTLQSGTGYAGAGNAVVNILDNDPVTVDISGGSQAYGRYSNTVGPGNNDFIPFTVTRRGKLHTGSDIVVNLSYSGSAVAGTDFQPTSTVTIVDDASTNTLFVPPVDNPNVFTNRTVVPSVIAGSGYAIGSNSASGIIVPAHYAAAPIIYTNDLQSANDATNWNVVYGSGDTQNNTNNFSADFGMNLSAAAGGIVIPPPPGGNANALHLTCNKQSTFAPGAVNAYLTNIYLSGNFSVRFNMNLIEGQQNATEGAIFGINHTGSLSNWWYGSGYLTNINWSSDGIWYFVTAQPAGASAGDYMEFTGLGGTNGNTGWQRPATKTQTSFSQVFKDNPGPFTTVDLANNQTPGVPANAPGLGYDASTWVDVEIKQQDDVVTLSINHSPIFVYTNTTVWKGGYLMLGYADPFGGTSTSPSVGTLEAGVYYANLEVIQNPNVTSTGLSLSGTNVVVKFNTTSDADTASSFSLLTSTNLNYWTNFTGVSATFAPTGSKQFQATTPFPGGAKRFYRVIHN